MKRIFLFTLLLFWLSINLFSQNSGFVGIGTLNPSAQLQVVSDSSGLLIPKYNTLALANSNSLPKLNSNDHKGLMIYIDETDNRGFWYYDGAAFVKAGDGASFFTINNSNSIVYSDNSNYGKNFLVNTDSINYVPESGILTKMMLIPSKNAFRAGAIVSAAWDMPNIGNYSFGSGFNTTAFGVSSTAMGQSSKAYGEYSTAIGNGAVASGFAATAFGQESTASGSYSTATGFITTASGQNSFTSGQSTTASNTNTTALGYFTRATNGNATAMGDVTWASGEAATAMGSRTLASGAASTSLGVSTVAKSYAETSTGIFNTDYTPGGAFTFNSNDRAFVIGIGTAAAARADGLITYKDGTTFIGRNTSPIKATRSTLQVAGNIADSVSKQTGETFVLLNTSSTILDNYNGLNTVTYTLPNAINCFGRKVTIKKINVASHAILITSNGGMIEGSTPVIGYTIAASSNLSTITLQSDGVDWWIINRF